MGLAREDWDMISIRTRAVMGSCLGSVLGATLGLYVGSGFAGSTFREGSEVPIIGGLASFLGNVAHGLAVAAAGGLVGVVLGGVVGAAVAAIAFGKTAGTEKFSQAKNVD